MSIRPISKVINNRPTDIQSLPNSRDAIASKKVFSLKTVTELHYCNNFNVHFITLKGKYNINKLFYRTYGNLVIHITIYMNNTCNTCIKSMYISYVNES